MCILSSRQSDKVIVGLACMVTIEAGVYGYCMRGTSGLERRPFYVRIHDLVLLSRDGHLFSSLQRAYARLQFDAPWHSGD